MRRRTALLVLGICGLALTGLAVWTAQGESSARAGAMRATLAADTGPGAPSDPPAIGAFGTLSVEVVDGRGIPVAGVDVSLTADGARVARAPTGATGVAAFGGRAEREVEAWVHPPGEADARLPAGRFAPDQGDARLRFVLRPPQRLVLEVSCDGKRGLPDRWRVSEPVLLGAVADREAGIVRGRFHPTRPDGQVHVAFDAPDYIDGGAEIVLAGDRDPAVARIDLVTGCHVVALGPGGLDLVRQLRMEQMSAAGAWQEVVVGAFEEIDDGLIACSYRVRPGRCRVVLASSGAIVSETTVSGAERERDLPLGLAGAGWCDVRLAVPDGYEPGFARLVVAGDRLADGMPKPRGRPGQWRLLVPGDRTLSVHAVHPLLLPAREGGTQPLVPGSSVVLKMEPGSLLRFRFVGPGAEDLDSAGVTIRAHEGADPVFRGNALPVESGHAVTGWEPGSFVVTVDPFRGAPVTVRARLDPAGADLGDLPFARGSRIRVVHDGSTSVSVIATSATHPGVRRWSRRDPSGEVVGLPAGSWDLEIVADGMRFLRTLTVDGRTDVAVPLGGE